ncbi:MAG: hypothetical protein ACXABV_04590 [Candidatus Thorarchaeota archaeon]|jgi:hypothetical protein
MLKSKKIGLVVLVMSILSPFVVIISFGLFGGISLSFWTVLFRISISPLDQSITLHNFFLVLQYLPFVSIRFAFAYLMMRYYEDNATGGMLILSGIAGELIPVLLVLSLPPVVLSNQLVFPLPLHLLAGFIIVALKPPPAVTSPWDAVDEVVETNLSQKS